MDQSKQIIYHMESKYEMAVIIYTDQMPYTVSPCHLQMVLMIVQKNPLLPWLY